MEATRRIDDEKVRATRDRRLDRVECHRCRILPGSGTDEVRTGTRRPHAKLVDRAGAKCVARRHGDALIEAADPLRELADERRLARAVHADHENHRWRSLRDLQPGIAVSRLQRVANSALQGAEELVLGLHEAARGEPLDLLDEPQRGRDADVGLEQDLLQLLEVAGRYAASS